MSRVASTTPPDNAVIPERHPDAPKPGQKIPSHFVDCFGCGVSHPTGLHLVAIAGEGLDLTAKFTVTRDHQGAPGLAHGGLLSLAFDEAHGKLMWLLRAPAVTGRLETDFLAPVPVGSVLHITAKITGQSGRKVYTYAEGHLNSVDGPIAVKSAALFVVVPMEHFINNAPSEFTEIFTSGAKQINSIEPNFSINP